MTSHPLPPGVRQVRGPYTRMDRLFEAAAGLCATLGTTVGVGLGLEFLGLPKWVAVPVAMAGAVGAVLTIHYARHPQPRGHVEVTITAPPSQLLVQIDTVQRQIETLAKTGQLR